MNRFSFGEQCEAWVAQYLEVMWGWQILAERFRFRSLGRAGELDLVAIDPEGELHFVEVKGRRNEVFGSPLEALTPLKVAHLHRSSLEWKSRHNSFGRSGTARVDPFLFCGVTLKEGYPLLEFLAFE